MVIGSMAWIGFVTRQKAVYKLLNALRAYSDLAFLQPATHDGLVLKLRRFRGPNRPEPS